MPYFFGTVAGDVRICQGKDLRYPVGSLRERWFYAPVGEKAGFEIDVLPSPPYQSAREAEAAAEAWARRVRGVAPESEPGE